MAVDRKSQLTTPIGELGAEVLGSVAVLAASLVLGVLIVYLVALFHRSEQRGALNDVTAMMVSDDFASPSDKVPYRFLETASDVIIPGDRLAPGEDCAVFLAQKIHALHPDFDITPAHRMIRHFCDSGGTHGEIEPIGQLNLVLVAAGSSSEWFRR
jgi:hypothetical protein